MQIAAYTADCTAERRINSELATHMQVDRLKPCASLVQIREIPLKNCGIVDFPQCRTRFDGFYSLVNPETFDVSHFHVRILLAELFLEHLADLAACFALLFHALDGLVGGKEGGGADL